MPELIKLPKEDQGEQQKSDIKLEEDKIVIQGKTIDFIGKAKVYTIEAHPLPRLGGKFASDIRFIADRLFLYRKAADASNDEGANIALSHAEGDQLVINQHNGYKGGVSIEGNVTLASTKTWMQQQPSPSPQSPPSRVPPILSPMLNSVKIDDGEIQVYRGLDGKQSGSNTYDLIAEFERLRSEVKQLKDRVAQLEEQVRR